MPRQLLRSSKQAKEPRSTPSLAAAPEIDLDDLSPDGLAVLQGTAENAALHDLLLGSTAGSGAAEPADPGSTFSCATSGAVSALPGAVEGPRGNRWDDLRVDSADPLRTLRFTGVRDSAPSAG